MNKVRTCDDVYDLVVIMSTWIVSMLLVISSGLACAVGNMELFVLYIFSALVLCVSVVRYIIKKRKEKRRDEK